MTLIDSAMHDSGGSFRTPPVCSVFSQQTILLFLLSYLFVGTAFIPGIVLLLFVLRLEPDNDEDEL